MGEYMGPTATTTTTTAATTTTTTTTTATRTTVDKPRIACPTPTVLLNVHIQAHGLNFVGTMYCPKVSVKQDPRGGSTVPDVVSCRLFTSRVRHQRELVDFILCLLSHYGVLCESSPLARKAAFRSPPYLTGAL